MTSCNAEIKKFSHGNSSSCRRSFNFRCLWGHRTGLSISHTTALRTVTAVSSPASYTRAYHCQQLPPPPKKFHLINNICFQGSSPLLLFHLCLGYHSNYSLSSVIPSLYISAPSHDWLPASTLIIAGGNAQKVVASCFLLQATQLLSCFTFPPAT